MKSLPSAVSRIGAVSPNPRATASMTEFMIPEPAVGMTMRSTIFHRGTPKASAASRRSFGTRRRLSSVARVMIGHMSTVSAMEPATAIMKMIGG